jgi:hypothetical protein
VEDHHVDRPGVEVQQCMELTGTNSSIGLITLIYQCSSAASRMSDQNCSVVSGLFFAGLVIIARSPNPIPSRTRPLNSSAPMVLCLKARESRSSPGLPRTELTQEPFHQDPFFAMPFSGLGELPLDNDRFDAGWSSPVARQAHNLKVAGSNPAPATSVTCTPDPLDRGFLFARLMSAASSPKML